MLPRAPRQLALFLAFAMATAPLHVFAQTVSATTEIAEGDKATRKKDYEGALAHYRAANQATPSWRAQLGVADALYQLGRAGESYDVYDDAQRTYAGKLGAVEKGLVAARLKDLGKKTGWLSIRVSEEGAEVSVDGKVLGTSPVPALLRFAVGTHDVRVMKAGFTPFTGRAEVAADGKAVVDATLARQATQGHLVVHSNAPDPLRVLVDGVDVGATPWEGDVAPGPHDVAGRSSTATAPSQKVDVALGARVAVDLAATASGAHVQVRTSDGKGLVYLDGVVKGEGAFSTDVPVGSHTIVVSREGYERFEKTMTLDDRQTWAETVTLKPTASAQVGTGSAERSFEGIYGGFGLVGGYGVGGQGTELDTSCGTLGAVSCDTPSPYGGGAFGYVGWTWNPVGFELMLGGMGDTVKQKAMFDGFGRSGNLPLSMPAREEDFTFARFGGLAAVRARASFQSRLIRGTVAGGVGISYKQVVMQRIATATDGTDRSEKYVPDPVGYLSPAVTAEGALQIRLSPTTALAVGLLMWVDNASIAGSNAAPASSNHALVSPTSSALPAPIPTPQYHLASGPQVFLGPFIGMQFGP